MNKYNYDYIRTHWNHIDKTQPKDKEFVLIWNDKYKEVQWVQYIKSKNRFIKPGVENWHIDAKAYYVDKDKNYSLVRIVQYWTPSTSTKPKDVN